jgi:hypothetical protein
VLRNRLGAQQMVNKEKMEKALEALAKRIGFRVVPGFHERVIFRELFPRGLTLLDLRDIGVKQLNISNVAARQELRDLIKALDLPDVEVNFCSVYIRASLISARRYTPFSSSVRIEESFTSYCTAISRRSR